jgi:MFS transporter, PHS family, inorganic phosphate transporter
MGTVPGEAFPTRYRSTAHGISAAAGKTGAVIAQALIGPLRNKGGTNKWLDHVMQIFALFMFCGIFTTLLIPETKRLSLEEINERYHGELKYSSGAGAEVEVTEFEGEGRI